MPNSNRYYTLVTRDSEREPFSIQFGDYTRTVVEQERIDSYAQYGRKDWRILRTTDEQQDIENALWELNIENMIEWNQWQRVRPAWKTYQ